MRNRDSQKMDKTEGFVNEGHVEEIDAESYEREEASKMKHIIVKISDEIWVNEGEEGQEVSCERAEVEGQEDSYDWMVVPMTRGTPREDPSPFGKFALIVTSTTLLLAALAAASVPSCVPFIIDMALFGFLLRRDLAALALEAGKLADLQVLGSNPLDDLENTVDIEYVMKNGRLYEAATLDEVWPRQRELPTQWWWRVEPP